LTDIRRAREANPLNFLQIGLMVAAALATSCTERPSVTFGPDGCDFVPMQSDDGATVLIGLRHDRIMGVESLQSRVPVLYVPVRTEDADAIEVWLWGPREESIIACESFSNVPHGPVQNCFRTVPGTDLRLRVMFRPDVDNASHKADLIAEFVAREVLCGD
jgi:hypothetical protein